MLSRLLAGQPNTDSNCNHTLKVAAQLSYTATSTSYCGSEKINMEDYGEDVRIAEEELAELGHDDPSHTEALNDLAVALHARYDEHRHLNDIRRAVEIYDDAI
jgi:hypothetical protein